MSDDDTLISQDDIDRLLSASSLDDGDDDFDILSDDFEDSEDELVSQDDIDSLLDASRPEKDTRENSAAEEEEDLLVSQDDIDKLFGTVQPDDVSDTSRENMDDSDALVSQDDIDQLLNASVSGEETASDNIAPDDDDTLISQDDIDSLFSSSMDEDTDTSGPGADLEDEEDFELISQNDIQRLMTGKDDAAAGGEAAADKNDAGEDSQIKISDNDTVIDPSEACDIKDCLITQSVIDRLIAEDEAQASTDRVSLDEAAGGEAPEEEQGASTREEMDAWEAETEDISQEDIDSLLKGSDDESRSGDDTDEMVNLISQNDIEELLKGSEEDYEDILGETLDDGPEDFDDLAELDEEMILEPVADQVVLEEPEERSQPIAEIKRPEKSKPAGAKWYRSKKFMIAASVILASAIGLSAGYTVFFKKEAPLPVVQEIALQEDKTDDAPPVEAVKINLEPAFVEAGRGTLSLDQFVVFPSKSTEGPDYIVAGILIDYSSSRARQEIDKNIPLYRDIIYDAISRRLQSEDGGKLTEEELLKSIKEALNRTLSKEYVEAVTFTSFKTG